MKNRKTVVVAFLLVCCMILGVGYAALTVDLNLTGNATFNPGQAQNEFTEDIYLGNSAVIEKSNGTAPDSTYTKTTKHSADLAVNSLALDGNTVTYTITVYNESVHEAELSIKSLKIMGDPQTESGGGLYTGDEWLSTKVEYPSGSTIAAGTDNGGGSITPSSIPVKITFTLLKNPTSTVVRSINITFTATTTD
ncbi:MAG: hypothetical protein IJ445_03805 [Clostridia bacterium]|nr:hypothetical protein [Clostridia bacterium]